MLTPSSECVNLVRQGSGVIRIKAAVKLVKGRNEW